MSEDSVDRWGAVASSVCTAHCAISALLPSALAAMGLNALFGHEAEWAFTLVAVGLATLALIIGWRKHRSGRVAFILAAGIAGLLLARLLEEEGGHFFGTAVGVLAGVTLIIGHISNSRASRRCQPECA